MVSPFYPDLELELDLRAQSRAKQLSRCFSGDTCQGSFWLELLWPKGEGCLTLARKHGHVFVQKLRK